jgi:dTDP-4-amino-4,6-dideoxygalactose transaminase
MEVPFFDLNYGPEEEEAALETIRSGWISTGSKCEEFEERWAQLHGVEHGVSLSSCTAALHLAMRALDIGPGDEVIVPSLTFVATASSVRMVGATPVFADVESLDQWTLSPSAVAEAVTEDTQAVIAMHYGGYGADMPSICDVADAHDLYVVGDACHAPMGKRKDQMIGAFGDISCFSFYANKNISTAEGGMLLTDHEDIAERVRILRSHGMTSTAYEREDGKEFYDVKEFGYNYRMDDIRASIGLAQLEKLPEDIEKRQRLVRRYRENLADVDGVRVPFSSYEGRPSNYVFGVLTDHPDRAKLREQLGDRDIGTSMHYPPVHQFECYEPFMTSLPVTEEIGRREISLPLFHDMTLDQVDYVCESLQECLRLAHDPA